ncbi:GNAT family N-acetyltransferase [Streptococcus sp. X16XC17]|uniref:GNAT family N-acetyltransferase n=1 Tax=unclassified Streptococcus TaxID=2608887 RepID=UPI00066FECD0|nr:MULTISPECIES: GNAT family N-acetyltransferase [unclassified Streptococcus]TCD46547.1 GNAT family N-acetyltransferase [Streptococcus sp. X16XC17]
MGQPTFVLLVGTKFISDQLRLRPFRNNDDVAHALIWYQDPEMVYLVDGVREPYTMEKLQRMYTYLNDYGQLYWIDYLENGSWKAIGDVTLCEDDLPIVIGDMAYRGRGIGRAVLSRLIEEARLAGRGYLAVREIYDFNLPSQACFEACGFQKVAQTEKGYSYRLNFP